MTGFIDNSVLQNDLCGGCECKGFAAKLSYVADTTAKTVKVTSTSTFDSGDSLLSVNVHVTDRDGKQVHGHIAAGSTEVTVNVATLNLSSLDITGTVVSAKGCKADLGIYKIGSVALSGSLLYKNNQ